MELQHGSNMSEHLAQAGIGRHAVLRADEVDAARKPQRIFIDCTSTYMTGLNTGIQRVVRGLVERERALSAHAGIPCIPVIAFKKRYWPFSQKERAWVQPVLTGSVQSRRVGRGRFVRFERAFLALSERLHVPRSVADVPLDGARHVLTRLFWRLQTVTPLRIFHRHKVQAIRSAPGDLLLIPDAFWGEHGQLPAIERFAAAGGAILPIIHDITPLTHSAYFLDFNIRQFVQGLASILRVACGVLTVSRAVMFDVGNYCAEQGYGHLPLDYAYSGADIARPVTSEVASVRPHIAAQCQARPFLMVGTVEPRKGHLTALDAYALYQKAGGRRPLVIVGRLGWKEFDIVARVQAVASSSGSVFFCHDASDAELAAFYQQAGALIFASYYEGFGLPLVEAMHQGLPVIASDIPVFREIGGDYPAYFHVGSAEDLCRAMQEHDRAEGHSRKPPRLWPTWDEAAPGYIDKAIALYQKSLKGPAV